jgi:hypothetical protein
VISNVLAFLNLQIPDPWHGTLQHLSILKDDNTGSEAVMGMASHWLHSYVQSHASCRFPVTRQYSPTRVLDIDGQEQGTGPILRQHFNLDSPYIALSHRWGSTELPSTRSANLAQPLQCLPLAQLSQTIRNAVAITAKLGFRYLWIDTLCIAQDS